MVAPNGTRSKDDEVHIPVDVADHRHLSPDILDALLADPAAGWCAPADWRDGSLWCLELLVEVVRGNETRFRAFVLTNNDLTLPDPRAVVRELSLSRFGSVSAVLLVAAVPRPRLDLNTIHIPRVIDQRTAA
ncbi:MAG: hypothetical protein FJ304_15090 [Planctomycetes bacterium]|nr:hypothetical protein [Planctomycetota bacterium]